MGKTKVFLLLNLIATIAGGLPVWFNAQHNHNNDFTVPFFTSVVLAGVFKLGTNLRMRRVVLATVTGVMLALISKIFMDIHSDPTSHNLFPFEIVINGILLTLAATLGGGMGRLIQLLRSRL